MPPQARIAVALETVGAGAVTGHGTKLSDCGASPLVVPEQLLQLSMKLQPLEGDACRNLRGEQVIDIPFLEE